MEGVAAFESETQHIDGGGYGDSAHVVVKLFL